MVEKLLNSSEKELSHFRAKHWRWMLHRRLLDVLSQNITFLIVPATQF